MITLYRSGKANAALSANPAQTVAEMFDTIALSLGMPEVRKNAVYFTASYCEAMRWVGQRYNNGLDSNVYSVNVKNYSPTGYNVKHYNTFKNLFEEYCDLLAEGQYASASELMSKMSEAVKAYHLSEKTVTQLIQTCDDNYEVIIPANVACLLTEWNVEYELASL